VLDESLRMLMLYIFIIGSITGLFTILVCFGFKKKSNKNYVELEKL